MDFYPKPLMKADDFCDFKRRNCRLFLRDKEDLYVDRYLTHPDLGAAAWMAV